MKRDISAWGGARILIWVALGSHTRVKLQSGTKRSTHGSDAPPYATALPTFPHLRRPPAIRDWNRHRVGALTWTISSPWAQENQPDSTRDAEIVGIWLGTLDPGGEPVRVVFKISRDAGGNLVASMDSPNRGRKDLAVTKINWQSGSLHLEAVRGRAFDGVLSQDGQELEGQWQQDGRTLPLKLRQVAQAPEIRAIGLGIYVAAALTSLLALLIIGGVILVLTPRNEWRFIFGVATLHLPMPAIAWGLPSAVYATLGIFYAPLIEEPSKLWWLLVPAFARRLPTENAPRTGMAIGLGFGIGEAWFVASAISSDPGIIDVPWYQFWLLQGYMVERFMTCIFHGVFTAAALRTIRLAPVRSILFAMTLHFISNFPLALSGWNFGGLGESAWSVIVPTWMTLYFFAMVALLIRFLRSADPEGWQRFRLVFLGKAKCPGCGLVFERRWLAINWGTRRFERCPGCKTWHLTTRWKEEGLKQTRA